VQFFNGAWGEEEWECVELVMRYMYLAWGVNPYPSPGGEDVAHNYAAWKSQYNPDGPSLQDLANGETGIAPQVGDVLSYTNGFPGGHAAVVTASSVDGSGNGSLTVIEQNFSSSGMDTLSVKNWSVSGGVTDWLHNPAGSVAWTSWYGRSGCGGNEPYAITVSPDEQRVYVTGSSASNCKDDDYITVVYGVSSGHQLWVARYSGGRGFEDDAQALALSADGSRLYVTGQSSAPSCGANCTDIATVAYDSSTGAQLWVSRYDSGYTYDYASAITLTDGGNEVVVAGRSGCKVNSQILSCPAVLAYDSGSGSLLWKYVQRIQRVPSIDVDVATNPVDGSIYIVGSTPDGSRQDLLAVALSAGGSLLWSVTYKGNGSARGIAVRVSMDGTEVLAAGNTWPRTGGTSYAIIAFAASDGSQIWSGTYQGSYGSSGIDGLALDASNGIAFVTGNSSESSSYNPITTIAYRTATGDRLWIAQTDPSLDGAYPSYLHPIAVGPGGHDLYVAGSCPVDSIDHFTVWKYNAQTGNQVWQTSYDLSQGDAYAVAPGPLGDQVFATGRVVHEGPATFYMTTSYLTGDA